MSTPSSPYRLGDNVPFHISPAIVVASCIPSLIGSITAVELLHRKRANKGWIHWAFLLGIAVSIGLVAVWCMHFVGNRAIILGDGQPELQLVYSPGYTALSAFLPIIFLLLAFTVVEFRQPGQRFFWPCLVVSGFIVGLAFTGMHYVGNFGIRNYELANRAANICGAAAFAVAASITALSLFFYFQETWVNSFWRRIACATVLASAVPVLHWIASIGTTYKLREEGQDKTYSRNVNLIVAIICGLLACALCFVFAVLTQRRKKELADRAQHVVLASATFDPDGRLLVTQEGLPPCRKVTRQFNQKSFDDEFDVAHPVFQWLYRVTFNWPAIIDLLPGMRTHLRAVGYIKDRRMLSRPDTSVSTSETEDNDIDCEYSILFREYFCVAADELASSLDTDLPQLGVLYDRILATGSITHDTRRHRKSQSDLEKGQSKAGLFGKGQLLFVVRTVDKLESSKLVARGYRFANPVHICDIIARTMRVPPDEMSKTVDHLRVYTQARQPLTSSGSYLACFAIRASFKGSERSWDIIVPTDRSDELPTVQLSSGPLQIAQVKRLAALDGLSVSECTTYLNNIAPEVKDPDDKDIIEHLLDQITQLTRQVPEDFFQQAIFSSQPVSAPGLGYDRDAPPPHIYAFTIIPDVHGASVKSKAVTYVPLSFFQCIQRVYKHSPDHAILAQRIHREFGAILSRKDLQAYSERTTRVRRSAHQRLSRLSIPSVSIGNSPRDSGTPVRADYRLNSADLDNATIKSESASVSDEKRRSMAMGGIMVSSDTKVEFYDKEREGSIEMANLGVHSSASVATEAPTYVDELFRITSARWRQR